MSTLNSNTKNRAWLLIPLGGNMLFALLYVVATFFYPGGSQSGKDTPGFSWTHNYWCNLLSDTAINGQPNEAQPIAMAAAAVLCLSLVSFWYLLPLFLPVSQRAARRIRVPGVLSMLIGWFHFTALHDTVINTAGFLGVVALVTTLAVINKMGWRKFLYSGVIILLLIGLNNLLYYNKDLWLYLPVVQKTTFVYFLGWISCLCLRLHRSPVVIAPL